MKVFFTIQQLIWGMLLFLSSAQLMAQSGGGIEQQPTGAAYKSATGFHQRGLYKEALALYNKALEEHGNQASGISNIILKNIALCEYGAKRKAEPEPVSITKLGADVNGSNISNTNAFVGNKDQQLFFTSSRPETGASESNSSRQLDYVYVAKFVNSAERQWDVNIVGKKHNKRLHEGVLGTSPDGKEVFIFRGSGDFFVLNVDFKVEIDAADITYTPLTKIYNVPKLKDYHVPSMAINRERNIIYMCMNDMGELGGHGGYDIWQSTYDVSTKSWSKPANMGPMINTEGDESCISLLPDGKTIFFSSNGYKGFGKFDIYRSEYSDSIGSWGKPVHLGYPINTAGNDIYYSPVPGNSKCAYYSSERTDGSGMYDISMITYYGKIVSEEEREALRRAYLKAVEEAQKSLKAKEKLKPSETKLLTKKGYNSFPTDSVAVGMKIYLQNIQFANAKATLLSKSYKQLDQLYRLMLYYPAMKIEISGHTDNTGNRKQNQRLSQERAESVMMYLKGRGIESNRMKVKGYSDLQPIAPNKTEAGRKLNRRVEFKVLSVSE
ncbi:MAG: OmpA family protein [Prevotellaceae bacterium]|jgi:outer membrane protein OmpA-like peptidoglycan-associated protein|nr:OmpA family protein [Prevotellaceae bacterium]